MPEHGERSGDIGGAMDAFQADLEARHLAPLWGMMRRLAPLGPARGGQPMHWSWDVLRACVMRAGELVDHDEAERRVLVLENPEFAGEGKVTTSLYGGIQLLLPGEVAPSHRHTASALRLIIEGEGGYTSVDGERVAMSPGDFIVTPSGTFHDHGNEGDRPVIWLDGLDVFVVNLLNAPFGEPYPQARQPVTKRAGEADALYAHGMLPHGYARAPGGSPLFYWPYARTRRTLETLLEAGRIDPALGIKMDFVDPTTARSPIATMTASMRLLPAGFAEADYRCVSGTVMHVIEGRGRVTIGGKSWEIGPHDVFVVPGWTWSRVEADETLVLFSFSDEVLQRHLGFWREERRARGAAG